MALSEFDIIARYFTRQGAYRDDVVLGVGDDAALLKVPRDRQLVLAVDTLVAGRHFPEDAAAFDIGWKALAVNLSDFAAMGATPAWATLSLTMPAVDKHWLQAFADGFYTLAEQYQVALVGGDTTRGPLSVSVQLQGYIKPGKVLRRDAAKPGQALFVSGTLGDAACALHQLQSGAVDALVFGRLNRPEPRVALGQLLGGVAAAAIDVSDGLLADLGHILEASRCGATLYPERLPASAALQNLPAGEVLEYQCNGGDDYELCFSVAPERRAQLDAMLHEQALSVAEIGVIDAQPGLRCKFADGRIITPAIHGFDHFLSDDDD
ncbi:MAG: thiamine-phosphate kinase [Thiogranum sp.]|jgi:thiamine-monophosphate kinase|nr:thiamine-phosphate kinase [Thiogranum sp.]